MINTASPNSKPDSRQDAVYDNILKTLVTRHTKWLIPLINNLFSENYSETETVQLLNETHYIKRHIDDDKFNKILTDCLFTIGKEIYHIELQSTYDGEMIIRVVEYDIISALENIHFSDNSEIDLKLPHSAVIFLRPHKKIPDEYHINIISDNKTLIHNVKVMKFNNYSLEEIFEKKLLLLLPFYIIKFEKMLKHGNTIETELALNNTNHLEFPQNVIKK